MPHGFALTAANHRLLRSHPPASVLRWCEAAVGSQATVIAVEALPGGTASAVHGVDIQDGRGRARRLVLRRFVRTDWLEEEPDAPRREAATLELVRACSIPTPALVAVDPDGGVAGVPAVLMTRLEGVIEWDPADLDPFLRQLAEALPEIHAVSVAPDSAIPAYDPYTLEAHQAPSWSRQPDLWLRAVATFREPPPTTERRFIHRDYHPGNVLWSASGVSGIVDWVHASIGSPLADVGHCRRNLAGELGTEAADRFLDLYLAISGREDYHPYWDIVAALGGVDEADLERWTPGQEEFVLRAVRRLST